MIFGDATLIEMAAFRPTDPEALLRINGVGGHKLGRYGGEFLEVLRGYGGTVPGKKG